MHVMSVERRPHTLQEALLQPFNHGGVQKREPIKRILGYTPWFESQFVVHTRIPNRGKREMDGFTVPDVNAHPSAGHSKGSIVPMGF
eukprot:1159648-Pelagomonas_calceolata.AAC.6